MTFVLVMAIGGIAFLHVPDSLYGQRPDSTGFYHPLNQTTPPGVAGYWSGARGLAGPGAFQLFRIELPGGGQVTLHGSAEQKSLSLNAPAQIGMGVGHIYRFGVREMPDFAGIELFPSLEIIDQLHPPRGEETKFPVPVQITHEEIELVLAGRFITKVIFLENPRTALGRAFPDSLPVLTIPPDRNLVTVADRLGRPLAILRMGGRLPDAHTADPNFFGSGGPIAIPMQAQLPRRNDRIFPASLRREQAAASRLSKTPGLVSSNQPREYPGDQVVKFGSSPGNTQE